MNKIIIKLNSLCNLKCGYCFDREKSIKMGYTHFNEINNKVYSLDNILEDDRFKSVVITGGEPTLHPEINNILNKLVLRKDVTLLTNGINRIENKDYLKNINIVISIDGNYKIMCKHRNLSMKSFNQICNNVNYYIENSKHVEISTLITKYNLYEKEYYPFQKFGQNCSYKFITPSLIFTPIEFIINPVDYEKVTDMIINFQKYYNFRINASLSILPTAYVKTNLKQVINSMFIIEYDVSKEIFNIFNMKYRKIIEFFKEKENIKSNLEQILEKVLKNYKGKYINPYNEIEKEIYSRII